MSLNSSSKSWVCTTCSPSSVYTEYRQTYTIACSKIGLSARMLPQRFSQAGAAATLVVLSKPSVYTFRSTTSKGKHYRKQKMGRGRKVRIPRHEYILSRHTFRTSCGNQKISVSQTEQTPECTGRFSLYKIASYLALLLLPLVDFTVSHPPPPLVYTTPCGHHTDLFNSHRIISKVCLLI
jgi:hypothetical protein